ncbi:TetR/AcrR family transcriptional regulator [Celeribacter halophilus]|uniref:TetR/AcrR family transcriptional regulator n=1 Tax=Celeribacter halophilus TaxID=576117 RepID=UPI001C084140|nr:TetR/AcrR family transcriptional regulator [Celeribacter halophilus]MBU2888641.1 TetR/AcrR family transcriptional regulator [Celeribacter halophilus]MDO6509004.1 TetR/AcrR family transcriptional regulator [Celeribacter halophilus]
MAKYQAEQPEDCCPARRRGRPVQMDHDAREAAILDAAHELMMEQGFDRVTMAGIARRAGMSKRTLYEYFDGQEALLGQVIARLSASFFRPLPAEDADKPLAERLRFLLTFNKPHGTDQQKREFMRTIIARAQTYPTLARELVQNGHERIVGYVLVELRREIAAGRLRLTEDRAALAAKILVSMVFEDPIPCLLDAGRPEATPEQRAERRDLAISLFLNGCSV